MDQKVNPAQVKSLADGMKRLEQNLGEAAIGKCSEIKELLSSIVKYHPESYVQSAVHEAERMRNEVRDLALRISELLRKKEKALAGVALKYAELEKGLVNKSSVSQLRSLFPGSPFTSAYLIGIGNIPIQGAVRPAKSEQSKPMLMPYNPENYVSEEDILNRDDPEVQQRLQNTYWGKLSKEEQDRRYHEIKDELDRQDREWNDKMRRYESGIGNQFVANLFVGGSNMVVNAINTATLGLPKTIGERIAGPMPESAPDPFNDPYGKKLGEYVGVGVGFMLPFKFLKGMKTPGVLSKLSPTVVRSMTAEAIYSTASEASDALTDYRENGSESLGDRASRVTVNTVAAGALDVGGTFIFNAVSKVVTRASSKIKEAFNRPKVEAKPPGEVAEVKAVEGTGKIDGMPPIVQSRINLRNGSAEEGAGFNHVLDRHFNPNKNASQFSVKPDELKSILQSKEVVSTPVSRVLYSDIKLADGSIEKQARYVREVTLDSNIGIDKFSGSPTNIMTVLTDKHGNLVTATPGVIK
ncbi:hypothetical protein [Paenibacillus sp. CAA11]|uniref:hypothetical protein n=1 Tax=Paenibacillus sp. CAA11 TaxID=1532905 RepID=UPI001F47F186|nr:hypothetical protein [Paenibacillus sp. CAA11]